MAEPPSWVLSALRRWFSVARPGWFKINTDAEGRVKNVVFEEYLLPSQAAPNAPAEGNDPKD